MTEEHQTNHTNGKFDFVGNLRDTLDALGTPSTASSTSTTANINKSQLKKLFQGIAQLSTEWDAQEYNMNHKNRGHAIIFNHENFLNHTLGKRTGTDKDCESLRKAFEMLDFQVKIHNDLTYSQILNEIGKVSEIDHTDNDCLVITILTHGGHGYIHSNDTIYQFETIAAYFTADRCRSLAGKPKLFFIQACRGENFDSGIKVRPSTEVDSIGKQPSFTIPVHADFLFVYSTVPGYYSWRNIDDGGWFIQTLCSELIENGTNYSLTDILTSVLRKVALEKESTTKEVISHEKKQIPCYTSTLIRTLRFNIKKKSDSETTSDNRTT